MSQSRATRYLPLIDGQRVRTFRTIPAPHPGEPMTSNHHADAEAGGSLDNDQDECYPGEAVTPEELATAQTSAALDTAIAYHDDQLQRIHALQEHIAAERPVTPGEAAQLLRSVDAHARLRDAIAEISTGHQPPEQTALVYGNVQAMLDAADEVDRRQALVDEHGDELKAQIGGALANAEKYGTGWIRIECVPTTGQPGTYDWTFSAPSPRTIVIREEDQ